MLLLTRPIFYFIFAVLNPFLLRIDFRDYLYRDDSQTAPLLNRFPGKGGVEAGSVGECESSTQKKVTGAARTHWSIWPSCDSSSQHGHNIQCACGFPRVICAILILYNILRRIDLLAKKTETTKNWIFCLLFYDSAGGGNRNQNL